MCNSVIYCYNIVMGRVSYNVYHYYYIVMRLTLVVSHCTIEKKKTPQNPNTDGHIKKWTLRCTVLLFWCSYIIFPTFNDSWIHSSLSDIISHFKNNKGQLYVYIYKVHWEGGRKQAPFYWGKIVSYGLKVERTDCIER